MAVPNSSHLTVADVMTTNPRTCSAFSSVLEASSLFQDADCGAVPVVDGGRPIGILTDRDVALAVANNPDLGNLPVADFMSKDIISVAPDASLEEVGALFSQHAIHRLLVVDAAGQLQGIVAMSDLAPHVSEASLGRMLGEVDEQQ
ncbi:MAG: CBS domain-containing protein [Isosphaeraceae bacterium]